MPRYRRGYYAAVPWSRSSPSRRSGGAFCGLGVSQASSPLPNPPRVQTTKAVAARWVRYRQALAGGGGCARLPPCRAEECTAQFRSQIAGPAVPLRALCPTLPESALPPGAPRAVSGALARTSPTARAPPPLLSPNAQKASGCRSLGVNKRVGGSCEVVNSFDGARSTAVHVFLYTEQHAMHVIKSREITYCDFPHNLRLTAYTYSCTDGRASDQPMKNSFLEECFLEC